ncbi:DUF1353 domain-containing protein [Treponema putidum]|uniref:Uncharacterized protein n=1 Tax=Treponema putidum TaxID=221027 RepID=A0ABY5HSM2_9SPIR|nr:DUF1353 domain-containing protein [Treponema putidum]UTY28413.1 hypothetical protein E4N76_04980 [Treponema putidum]UTY28436.1 hypothetical protein E4N76_05105 [Treponema putidum]
MKKIFFCFVIALFVGIEAYSQICYAETAFNAEKNRLLQIARSGTLPNGCGAAGTPAALVNLLNSLGDGGACDQHDIDYSTLGMSKEQADENFYRNLLRAGVPDYLALHFFIAVSKGGQSAYDSAQWSARTLKELEPDPSSREYCILSDYDSSFDDNDFDFSE